MKKTVKYILLLILIFNLGYCTVYADNVENTIKNFLNSIENKDGYINYMINITENKNNTYTLNLFIKENVTGIKLGFFASPLIMKNLNNINFKYNYYTEDEYLYIVGSKTYNNFENLSSDLIKFSFLKLTKENNKIYGSANLTIWNNLRKEDKLIDSIYNTNRYIFSYKPIKYINGNYTTFYNGEYIWVLDNKKENNIIIIKKGNKKILFVLILVGILFLSLGLYLILFKNNKYNNKSCYDNYNDYNNY